MAKLSKEEQARREGMAYAYKIAKMDGLDALEQDLKMRNAINLPLTCSKKDLNKFSDNVKTNMMYYFKILMMVTLHDEFKMGKKRLERFCKRFDLKASCLVDDYTTWEEQINILAEECNLFVDDTSIADITVRVGEQND